MLCVNLRCRQFLAVIVAPDLQAVRRRSEEGLRRKRRPFGGRRLNLFKNSVQDRNDEAQKRDALPFFCEFWRAELSVKSRGAGVAPT